MTDPCLFCKIVAGDIPATKAYEDSRTLAFADINPQAPVHLLVIPKRHIPSAHDLDVTDNELVGHLFQVIAKLARDHGVAKAGYRVVTNNGPAAGQSVPHLHYHLIGGRPMDWPPG
jgi:histidine triad (HIT) family protein